MSTLFNQPFNNDDILGFSAFNKGGISPKKKGLDPLDDLNDPFNPLLDFSSNNLFGHQHEFHLDNLHANNISRGMKKSINFHLGPSNFEIPVQKKLKVNHEELSNFNFQ
jgi:hypothetical protein